MDYQIYLSALDPKTGQEDPSSWFLLESLESDPPGNLNLNYDSNQMYLADTVDKPFVSSVSSEHNMAVSIQI